MLNKQKKRGRPPKTEYERFCQKQFIEALKKYSPEALGTILDLMKKGDNQTRLKAATYILDKSFGKEGGFLLQDEEKENVVFSIVRKED